MREEIMQDNNYSTLMILGYSAIGGVFASVCLTLFLFYKLMNRMNNIDSRLNLLDAPSGTPGAQFILTPQQRPVTPPQRPLLEIQTGLNTDDKDDDSTSDRPWRAISPLSLDSGN